MLGHLRPLVPGQRAPQLLRQVRDRAADRVAHRLGTMTRQRRPVPSRPGSDPRGPPARSRPDAAEKTREAPMSKRARKKKDKRKNNANHGKRPKVG